MRILLFGEFSSLHKYLKEGLENLPGIEVDLASTGDGWKRISGSTIQLPICNGRGKEQLKYYREYLKIIKKIKNYDVVQIIGPSVFPTAIYKACLKYLKKQNRIISLVAAGEDYSLVESYLNGTFEYYIMDQDDSCLKKYDKNNFKGRRYIKRDKTVSTMADVIIPSLYEYRVGYIGNKKIQQVVPFPINTEKINYTLNKPGDKIVFFHGLNREASKGTYIIRKAMEKLKEKYPEQVEIIIDGHMPFDKYMQLLKSTNVVVDQCLTYGYGINACISMAQGKIVMAPCRKETMDAFGIGESPIISIGPDEEQIFSQMEYIVKNRNKISELGVESRKYVEVLHDYKKVAKKYIEIWDKALNNLKM